jgi:hypothetical protein
MLLYLYLLAYLMKIILNCMFVALSSYVLKRKQAINTCCSQSGTKKCKNLTADVKYLAVWGYALVNSDCD